MSERTLTIIAASAFVLILGFLLFVLVLELWIAYAPPRWVEYVRPRRRRKDAQVIDFSWVRNAARASSDFDRSMARVKKAVETTPEGWADTRARITQDLGDDAA